jgi:hypothetical protein
LRATKMERLFFCLFFLSVPADMKGSGGRVIA